MKTVTLTPAQLSKANPPGPAMPTTNPAPSAGSGRLITPTTVQSVDEAIGLSAGTIQPGQVAK